VWIDAVIRDFELLQYVILLMACCYWRFGEFSDGVEDRQVNTKEVVVILKDFSRLHLIFPSSIYDYRSTLA
jgi:hypothetical protein